MPCLIAFFSLLVISTGCASAAQPDEYRESQNRVKNLTTDIADDYLRIVTFVRLADGSIQDPKLYYYQTHHTAFGVRKVEKPGRLWSNVTKTRKAIYLPVADDISAYLFLVSKPTVSNVVKDGVKKTMTDWSEWLLYEAPAKEVLDKKAVSFPPFEELIENAGEHEELAARLRQEYAKAEAAAKVRMNTPVKSRSEVPWYGQ